MKKIATIILSSMIGGLFSIILYHQLKPEDRHYDNEYPAIPEVSTVSHPQANYNMSELPDFTTASDKSIHAVVNVKNMTIGHQSESLWGYLMGEQSQRKVQRGVGSGVIISPDGYIVTNNHVIKGASEIQITLNDNKNYKAEIVGRDSATDIALLKINAAQSLPSLPFGDSNNAKIGEWVLAVGNPFNLTSTVTAGIISAKSRDLSRYDDKNQSFIQTDAAVNPGNSGGALVNKYGDLIGINTAITSYTGTYMGYSFAIPSNIVKKVVEDILEFGSVQRVILGVRGDELNAKMAEKLDVEDTEGFYVSSVQEESGAALGGILPSDIIKKIDNVDIHKYADLSGYISTKKPNDEVDVIIKRNNKNKNIKIKLSKNSTLFVSRLGIGIRELNHQDKETFGVDSGVKIIEAFRGINKGYFQNKVILEINNHEIHNISDVEETMETAKKSNHIVLILMNKNREKERYILRI